MNPVFFLASVEKTNMLNEMANSFGVQWQFLFAQIINFCLVAYILYRFALKPVIRTVEERQKKISEGLQYAEEMKAQLESTDRQRLEVIKKAHDEAKKMLERAKVEGDIYFQTQQKETAQKTEKLFKQAQKDIEEERRKMLAEIRESVASLVVQTTSQVLGKELDDQEKNKFNLSAVKSLSKLKDEKEI